MADMTLLSKVVAHTDGWYCVVGLEHGQIRSQKFYKTLDEVNEAADRLVNRGMDAFYGLGKFKTDENRKAENCGWMQSFFLDIDCGPTKATPDERGRDRQGAPGSPGGLIGPPARFYHPRMTRTLRPSREGFCRSPC